MTEIGLGTSALDASQLKLTYNYGTTTNNGNVQSQTISAPGLSLTQSFTYDELNRLSTSLEKQGTSVVWRQNYSYDRYGNRRLDEAGTTPALVGSNPTISAATNRISSAGYQYDAMGNLTQDPSGHSYQYDGESRMISFGAVTTSTYSYDGAGQRVKKVVGTGSLAVTTVFVYDAGGKLLAEYGTNTAGSQTGTSYVTLDRLGSTRLLTVGVIPRGGQAAKARYDYLPFGEEISTSYGNRSQAPGYTASEGMRQKFTGYERDLESGLDFAQARYYCNTQGRFISADSVGGSATSPQTLNRYAYTGNNPLNNVDPSGHMFYDASYNGSEGSGFSYPDNNPSQMPPEVRNEIIRMIWIMLNHSADDMISEQAPPQPEPRYDVEVKAVVDPLQDTGYDEQKVDNRTDEIVRQIYDKMSPSQYDAIANNRESGLSLQFCLCFASQESGFQRVMLANGKTQGIVGPDGDLGLFQIQYPTATDAAKRLKLGSVTKAQVRDNDALNTKLATNQLGYLIGRLGDIRSALAAYKQGYRGFIRDGMTVDSQMYADAILKCTHRISWK